MFEAMRRLHPREPENRGICVDGGGAALGPECVLVRRVPGGFYCVSPGEAGALQEFLFGEGDDPDWLFGQCRRIAEALADGWRTPRDYLRDKSWDEQYAFGLEALRRFGVLK
jgi:hypothetical protein